jgi:hypothetical protein
MPWLSLNTSVLTVYAHRVVMCVERNSQCLYSVYTSTWPYKQQVDWSLEIKYFKVYSIIGSARNVYSVSTRWLTWKAFGNACRVVGKREEGEIIFFLRTLNTVSQVALCHYGISVYEVWIWNDTPQSLPCCEPPLNFTVFWLHLGISAFLAFLEIHFLVSVPSSSS